MAWSSVVASVCAKPSFSTSLGADRAAEVLAHRVSASAHRELGWFFALAYAWSWAWWLPIVLEEHGWVRIPWHSKVPGILGPLLAALTVAAISRGPGAVRGLVTSMFHVHVGVGKFAAALSPLTFSSWGRYSTRPLSVAAGLRSRASAERSGGQTSASSDSYSFRWS
jgi:hypothetical protein